MSKDIESDGFITRESDVSSTKKICGTCKYFVYSRVIHRHLCTNGHSIYASDWRTKYNCCDSWESKP